MKTATEMRKSAQKAAYAVLGAPVVAGRRIAEYTGRLGRSAQGEVEAWVAEGEKVTAQLKERKVVTDLRERVDFDHLQGRVEKLRDQLEEVLANWRDNFKPADEVEATPETENQQAEPTSKSTTKTKTKAKKKETASA